MRFAPAILFLSILPSFSQSFPAPATVFSNLFGGRSGSDAATALAVDPSGNVAVIGTTTSPDFPVTHAYLPNVAPSPFIAVSQNGWTYPNLSGAVDVTAMTSTKDGSIVYAASDSGIFRSGDGGVSWTLQLPGLGGLATIAVDGGDSNTLYGVNNGVNSSVGAYKSTDGGRNWIKMSVPVIVNYDQATLLCPAQISGTIYYNNFAFYRSRDGGVTWTAIAPHNQNVFSFALAASDPNVMYTVASDGLLYRSTNGGDTWTTPGAMFTAYPNANANLYVYALAVDSHDENTVWALEATGNLYRSTDGGATFSLVLSDPADQGQIFLSVSPSGQNVIIASRTNAIATYDGGISWNRLVTGITINNVMAGQNAFFIESDSGLQGFLTKWSADGSHMIFSTFLNEEPGGRGPAAVASDASGNTYVAGQTLMKFSPGGDLLFSQSLGGLAASAMAIDSSGNVILATSPTNGIAQACGTAQGPTVMKFDPQGNLIFSNPVPLTCGSVSSIALDNSGAIYLVGNTNSASLATTPTAIDPIATAKKPLSDSFLQVLSPEADQVTYLSYLIGQANLVALDSAGNVYVTGSGTDPAPLTPTSTFTTGTCTGVSAGFAYVIKLTLSSPAPSWFSEIGQCQPSPHPSQLAVDANGNVWFGGATSSGSFPTVAPLEVQGTDQSFLSELSPDGRKLLFSSYAPGYFALGPQQTLYLTGGSTPNPPKLDTQLLTAATSAILEKLDISATQSAVIDSIGGIHPPATSVLTQLLGIAPGEMIRISGRGLGPIGTFVAQLDYTGRVATSLGGTQVLINGVPAPLISVQASSIVCMTPFEVSGHTAATVQIVQNGIATPSVVVGVKEVAYSPDVLAVVNANGTLNGPPNPAHPGQFITLYVTGFGGTAPPVPDGSLYQLPLPVPLYQIDSQNVTYAGPASGLVAGIWQVNVKLPSNAASGANPFQAYLNSAYSIGPFSPQASALVWVAP